MPKLHLRPAFSLTTALLGLSLALPVLADEHGAEADAMKAAHEKVVAARTSVMAESQAVVTAVDHDNRTVTLNLDGLVQTLPVGDHVERFDEVAVGDILQVDYLASVAREFREPTEEEKAEPFVVLEEAAKVPADLGLPPGVGGMRVIRAVCTVEGMSRLDNTAVLRGPQGNLFEVDVQNPERFDDVELGDSIVVTYTEALAVTLKKHN